MNIRTLLALAAIALCAPVGFSNTAFAESVIRVKCYKACVSTGTGTTCEIICVTGN